VRYYDKEVFDAPNGFELNIDCDADALASAPVEGHEDPAELIDDEYEKEIYGFE
jgi:hypothetical protein